MFTEMLSLHSISTTTRAPGGRFGGQVTRSLPVAWCVNGGKESASSDTRRSAGGATGASGRGAGRRGRGRGHRLRVLGDRDAEVRGEPGETRGVPLPHRAELPAAVPAVELAEDERGLRRGVPDREGRDLLPVRQRDPDVEGGHLPERSPVGGRGHHDPVRAGRDGREVQPQPVGARAVGPLALAQVADGARRVGRLVVEDEVGVRADPARRVEQQGRNVHVRYVDALPPGHRHLEGGPGNGQVAALRHLRHGVIFTRSARPVGRIVILRIEWSGRVRGGHPVPGDRPWKAVDYLAADSSAATSSAICTAFRAAPLRRLSLETNRARPLSTVSSWRIRPTYDGS